MKYPSLVRTFLIPLAAWSLQSAHGDVTVEALVDGPSALHVTPTSIYWVNGENAKPGRWLMQNEPTYINGKPWKPKWQLPKMSREDDISDKYAILVGTTNLELELISVTKKRKETGIEERTPITLREEDNEMVITIPDPEPEARWYKFILRPNTSAPAPAAKP